MSTNDTHRARIAVDTAEWHDRLERLADVRRGADDARTATEADARLPRRTNRCMSLLGHPINPTPTFVICEA
jgi:hypothetical protein